MWHWISRMLHLIPQAFSGSRNWIEGDLTKVADLKWLPPDQNRFGIRVLDLRPFTKTVTSVTTNRQLAENSVSYFQEDGLNFLGKNPSNSSVTPCQLEYRVDPVLAPGVLFTPNSMEQKWALFFHANQIIAVRSWTRQVELIGDVTLNDNVATVTSIRGKFSDASSPEQTIAWFDDLIRMYVLGEERPLWLSQELLQTPKAAANFAFNLFGNLASFATGEQVLRETPIKPLRSHSLLHIAVARGNVSEVSRLLDSGLPLELLAGDGLGFLHWGVGSGSLDMLSLLLDRGVFVDSRSSEGATPLMMAVQTKSFEALSLLLTRGADPNACDQRGFTALHRAADMGELAIARRLLEQGADPLIEAFGHTPLSFAEATGNAEMAKLIREFPS